MVGFLTPQSNALAGKVLVFAAMAYREERNQDATVYVGELDSRVSESLLWELMLQAGPVGNVYRH